MDNMELLPTPEVATITVEEGKVIHVHKADVEHVIEAKMETENLSREEAWEAVQVDFAASLNGTREVKKGRRQNPQTALFPPSPDAIVSATITIGDNDRTPSLDKPESKEGGYSPTAMLKQIELGKNSGKNSRNLMAEMSDGLDIEGQHPQAEILRAAKAPDPLEDKLDSGRVAARERAIQLGLAFPRSPIGLSVFPADFCRTSVFHVASNNVSRRECKQEVMGRLGNNTALLYDGTELRHDDERVLMQLIQIAQNRAPWDWIEISTLAFARSATGNKRKTLGMTDTESVEGALNRMRRGIVTVLKNKNFVTLNLIRELQGAGPRLLIQVDPRIVLLFGSYISFDEALYHATKGIERQLFKYLHTNPYQETYPIKVLSLFELCYGTVDALIAAYLKDNPAKTEKEARRAIETKKVSDFRKKGLPAALTALIKKDVVLDFSFDEAEDKFTIKKSQKYAPREPEEGEGK